MRVQGHCANIFVGSELKQQKADIVDETDRTMQDGHYIDQVALDVDYVNYVRETVPKTIWSNDYLQELWEEKGKYLKALKRCHCAHRRGMPEKTGCSTRPLSGRASWAPCACGEADQSG